MLQVISWFNQNGFFLYSINLIFLYCESSSMLYIFLIEKNPFIWIHCNKTMVEAHLYSNSIVPYFFRWFIFHHEDDHVIYVLNHLQFIFRQYNSIYLGITLEQKLNVEKLTCKEAKKTEAKKMNKIKYEQQCRSRAKLFQKHTLWTWENYVFDVCSKHVFNICRTLFATITIDMN